MENPSIIDIISRDLLIEKTDIEQLAKEAHKAYKSFKIGNRRIDAPKLELKYVQSWILDFVRAETSELPSHITAYEPSCSIITNAKAHCKNAHIMCLDIEHFFQSCTYVKVRSFFGNIDINLSEKDVNLLTSLSVYRGSLPMGSPCSPAVANRIMLPVDNELISELDNRITYTRYSDDITISSDELIDAGDTVRRISNVLGTHGFALNQKKIRYGGRGDARRVTGVYVTPDGALSIGSRRKRELNRMVYRFLIYNEGSASEILGMLNFASLVDSRFVTNLIIKYASYGLATEHGGVVGALKHSIGLESSQ